MRTRPTELREDDDTTVVEAEAAVDETRTVRFAAGFTSFKETDAGEVDAVGTKVVADSARQRTPITRHHMPT